MDKRTNILPSSSAAGFSKDFRPIKTKTKSTVLVTSATIFSGISLAGLASASMLTIVTQPGHTVGGVIGLTIAPLCFCLFVFVITAKE